MRISKRFSLLFPFESRFEIVRETSYGRLELVLTAIFFTDTLSSKVEEEGGGVIGPCDRTIGDG